LTTAPQSFAVQFTPVEPDMPDRRQPGRRYAVAKARISGVVSAPDDVAGACQQHGTQQADASQGARGGAAQDRGQVLRGG